MKTPHGKIYDTAKRIGFSRADDILNNIKFLLDKFPEGRLLDVGCGRGYLGHKISKYLNREIVCLDVKKAPLTLKNSKLIIYDGKTMPFKNNSYSNSLSLFSLHHCKNPRQVLMEMSRTTSDYLMIAEDFIPNRYYVPMEIIKDCILNCFLTNITLQYHTVNEWEKMFREINLVVKERFFFNTRPFMKMKHVAWLLIKQNA